MINYYLLMKPGIIFGNLVTVAAGFLLASKGNIHYWLFLQTMLGLGFIIASGCVFNNYINRNSDKKMERTKDRALVTGKISNVSALSFATILCVLGNVILWEYTNLLTVAIADIGFLIYVLLYSIWKGNTVYGTAIGSLSGAVPPVVGYCAVSGQFDIGALILFVILVLWQMPHFYAIAIYHLEDFKAGEMPLLPIVKGLKRTKIHMVLYILAFIAATSLLTFFGYTGPMYLLVVTIMGLLWLGLCFKGFTEHNESQWGRHMLQVSLLMIFAFCMMIPFDLQP